jgi:hypothetical protein
MADKKKKRRGDRKHGHWLRTIDPYCAFTPYIMKDRDDALNFFSDKVEISAAEAFLRKLRSDGVKGVGMLHLFLACYVRTIAKYPALNRFIAGQRIYARNRIEVVMTIKKKMSMDGGETAIKVKFDPTDGVMEIYDKIEEIVAANKGGEVTDGTDRAAEIFAKFPRFILRLAVRLFNWMDYHDLLPEALLDVSPFHGSIVVTDLGSLGIPPVFHHIYSFGNVPLFLAIGAKRTERELGRDGTVTEKRYLDYTVTTDERICDGFNFSVAFRYMKYLMRNPEMLYGKLDPSEVVPDID